MSPRPDGGVEAPSTGVLVAGALGVLVVLGFVAAVVLGGEARARPGDRVAMVERSGRIFVLAGRCEDERVTAVELRMPGGGPTLWRISSAKGSITQRYEVGAEELPVGFSTVAPLQPLPVDAVEAVVEIDGRLEDSEVVEQPAPTTGEVVAPCGRSQRLGGVALLFVAGALVVVVAFGAMVQRWLEERRGRS